MLCWRCRSGSAAGASPAAGAAAPVGAGALGPAEELDHAEQLRLAVAQPAERGLGPLGARQGRVLLFGEAPQLAAQVGHHLERDRLAGLAGPAQELVSDLA